MLVMSWNVASLATLVDRIHESYNPAREDTRKRSRQVPASVALQEFMRRHGADIYCFQEHKIGLPKLKSRADPRGCSMVEGYESFWSCCVENGSVGFNGVVTYARKGMVQSADAHPLGSKDLDDEGRCVMTDHGSFVLFNVYVPASGRHSLEFKMKFLNALRTAMQEQRKRKPVMLVGDLNIKHTALDRPWKDRVVHVNDVLEEVAASSNVAELPQWKRQVAQSWHMIMAAMETKRPVPTETKNKHTGQEFAKFRLTVTLDDGRVVCLGKVEPTEASCTYYYDFGNSHYYAHPETGEQHLAKEANVVTLEVLTELMLKIAGVKWDDATQRLISTTGAGVRRVDPPRQWLDSLIEEDGMVDTFRHFYPTAENRFTCWGQYTNRRYENDGIRLDYILVDTSLVQYVLKGDVPTLRCGASETDDPLGEAAALRAATANGAFEPASFAGGGIGAASQRALDTQFGAPHTGIIYTPPSFSDHVGVSLLMNDECCPRDLDLNGSDSAARNSQPHKSQKSIASFLCATTTAGRSQSSGSLATRFSMTVKKPEKKGMKAYFTVEGSTSTDSHRNGLSKRSKRPPTMLAKTNGKKKKGAISEYFRK